MTCTKNPNSIYSIDFLTNPSSKTTIKIIVSSLHTGQCEDLTPPSGFQINYNFDQYPNRPFGTVATYTCKNELNITPFTRHCKNGVFTGQEPQSTLCQGIHN